MRRCDSIIVIAGVSCSFPRLCVRYQPLKRGAKAADISKLSGPYLPRKLCAMALNTSVRAVPSGQVEQAPMPWSFIDPVLLLKVSRRHSASLSVGITMEPEYLSGCATFCSGGAAVGSSQTSMRAKPESRSMPTASSLRRILSLDRPKSAFLPLAAPMIDRALYSQSNDKRSPLM